MKRDDYTDRLHPSKNINNTEDISTNKDCLRTSSFCGTGGCVAVSMTKGSISVHDTKDLQQQPMIFTKKEWVAFTKGVKAGEFDF